MTSRMSRVDARDLSGSRAGPVVPRLVRGGSTAARWLVCAFLAVSAVAGAWQREAPEADWPLWCLLVENPPVLILAAAGLLVLGACAALEWQRVHREAYRGRPRLILASLAAGLLCVLLLVLAAATAPGALSPEAAWEGAGRLAVALALGLLAWLARPQPRELALALGMAAGVHALVGIAQFAGQWMGNLMPFGGLSELNVNVRGVSVVDVGGRHWLRAYGLSAHPNVLGGFLTVATLILLGALGSTRWSRRGRAGLWALICLALVALLLTFSRSAWIGLACGLGVLVWFRWRHGPPGQFVPRGRESWLVLGVIAIVAVTAAGVSPLIATRLTGGGSPLEAQSIEERRITFDAAWELLWRSPWNGVGLENSALALRAFLSETSDKIGNAYVHNVALMAATELGVGGGAAWIALGAAGAIVPWLARWRSRPRGRRPDGWATALGAAWLALWVIALFDYYPWLALRNGVIWPVLLGLWMASWTELR